MRGIRASRVASCHLVSRHHISVEFDKFQKNRPAAAGEGLSGNGASNCCAPAKRPAGDVVDIFETGHQELIDRDEGPRAAALRRLAERKVLAASVAAYEHRRARGRELLHLLDELRVLVHAWPGLVGEGAG